MTFRRRRLAQPISAAVVYGMVGSFPLFLAGAYAVRLQDEFGISTSQFGWTVSAYFVTSSAASFTLGRWIDRGGARQGFVAASLGAAASALLFGVAPQPWILAVALGLAGVANTLAQLAGNRVLAGVAPERQGVGFGAKQASVPLGAFIAGAAVGLAGGEVPWRASFFGYACVALTLAAIAPDDPSPAPRGRPRSERLGADRPFLVALASAAALGSATGNALAVLIVDAFDAAGYRESVAAVALAAGSAAAIVGRVGIGWFVGRRGTDGFGELTTILALGGAGFAILAVSDGGGVLLWLGVIGAFAAGWGWPGVIYYVVVRQSSSPPAAATGIVVGGTFLGAIGGAPLLATIAERASYGSAWTVASAMAFAGVAAVVLARRLVPVQPSVSHSRG